MSRRALNDFAMKGIFASYCVRDLQTAGLLRAPALSTEEQKDHDLFVTASEAIRTGSFQMQRYYRTLYVFENVVREFIDNTLREAHGGADWFDTRASKGLKEKYEKRKAQEEANQWHTGRNSDPLFYMDFGDLSSLIVSNWAVFEDFFPDQAWITSRISDTERTRNVIAHTNQLAAEEGARLEMHLRDWIKQIG